MRVVDKAEKLGIIVQWNEQLFKGWISGLLGLGIQQFRTCRLE